MIRIPNLETLKKEQQELNASIKSAEKYSFLDDVPNWNEKLHYYDIDQKFVNDLKKDSENFFFHSTHNADIKLQEFNEKYGGFAELKSATDGYGRSGLKVVVNVPYELYKDILDKDGNLLPTRAKS